MSKIIHFAHLLPIHRCPFITSEVFSYTFFWPVRRSRLAAVLDEFDLLRSFLRVLELFELRAFDGVLESDFPFIIPGADKLTHLLLEIRADTPYVLQYHLSEVF